MQTATGLFVHDLVDEWLYFPISGKKGDNLKQIVDICSFHIHFLFGEDLKKRLILHYNSFCSFGM